MFELASIVGVAVSSPSGTRPPHSDRLGGVPVSKNLLRMDCFSLAADLAADNTSMAEIFFSLALACISVPTLNSQFGFSGTLLTWSLARNVAGILRHFARSPTSASWRWFKCWKDVRSMDVATCMWICFRNVYSIEHLGGRSFLEDGELSICLLYKACLR